MSSLRGLGAAAVVLGLLMLAATVGALVLASMGPVEDPDQVRFFAYVRMGLLWSFLPMTLGTLAAGAGLMAHRAWARPLMLALVPWHVLLLLGIPVAIAALWLLTGDEADAVLA